MPAAPSTTRTTPRLSEVARHLVIPAGIKTSVWPRVERRLNDSGVFFDPWQQGLNTVSLGCGADGKYAATIGGVAASIPRQVGKTYDIGGMLIGLCLEFSGFRAAWTSHHNRTTTNTFRSIQGMVRRKGIAPHIAPNGIRTANGEQEIRFANGSILMFGAREQGFGRGIDALDALVFDEAQILTLKALEDMVPATNQARHSHGALVFFIGTPPRPTDPGEAFTAKREQAISGKSSNMVYVEIGADPEADLDDQRQWPKMNPSFPHRTPLESMLRMRANMPDDESWRREAMGIWPTFGGGLIEPAAWAKLMDLQSTPIDPVSFGVYVNRMQTAAAIGVAAYRSDGKVHVGIIPAVKGSQVDSLPGLGWIPDRIKELHDQWSPCATVIDNVSSAASLITEIEESGVPIEATTARDLANACSNFYAFINDDKLRHQGAQPLTTSVLSGKKRDLLDAWAWDRKDNTSDITQLMAVTLALHGLIVHGRPQKSAYETGELMVV